MGAKRSLGVSNEIAVPVVRALDDLGFSTSALVAIAASAPSRQYLGHEIVDAGLDAAAAALSDDALALTLAERLPLGALGTLDYALCTSASLGEGLQKLARYYGIATQRSELALVDDPPHASLVGRRAEGVSYSRHAIELPFAVIAARMRQTLGAAARFVEVGFAHAAPADTTRHERFFGANVRFSSAPDRLVFASELLALPLRTASRALAEVLEVKMRELATAAQGDPFLVRAHAAVAELLDRGEISLDALAAQLETGRRTLQRELRDRGTSHTGVLDAIRRERALALLSSGELSVNAVSGKLAFSEPSAFYRAFRRWTGASVESFRGKAT
jgi:AraC-like DNA-binding protein